MHKKGVSAVITSVLLISMVVVLLAVVWVVIQGFVTRSGEEISIGKVELNLDILKVYVDAGNLVVNIERGKGSGELKAINFILESYDKSEIIKQDASLREFDSDKFILSPTKIASLDIKKVSVAPILSSGTADITDVWEPGIKGTECKKIDCTGRECGDDGCGGLCNNGAETKTCSADFGTCHVQDIQNCVNGNYESCEIVNPIDTTCAGRVCGDDGCGGLCNNGAETKTCTTTIGTTCTNVLGTQTCVSGNYGSCVGTDPRIATCNGKQCGDDGCGGTCGTCLSTQDCNAAGLCLNKLRIFVTRSTTNGNLKGTFPDGIAGADNKCMIDLSNPNPSGTWKALIGSTSPARQVGTNWVLQANRNYYTIDRTKLIGTTNANGWFTFPLNNAINATSYSLWTGLGGTGINSGSNCILWTSIGGGGTRGVSSLTSNGSVSQSGAVACSTTTFRLYCVEQDS